jgi:putative hydrolase of the HAD superfamily
MERKFKFLKELKPIKTDVDPRIDVLKKIKAVIFDVYGTLVVSGAGDIWTTEIQSANAFSAFNSVGIKFGKGLDESEAGGIVLREYKKAIQEQHENLKGCGVEHPEIDVIHIWENVLIELKKIKTVKIPEDLCLKELALAFEFKTNQVWPMPYFNEIIQKIKNSNIELGIVSNSQFFTPMMMNYFSDNDNYLSDETIKDFNPDLCVYSYVEKKAKPSIDLFKKAKKILKKKYKIKPKHTLYVGNDMLNDVYCADKIGFKTCLFAGDIRSLRLRLNYPQVKKIKPDIIITELKQLEEALGLK